MSEEPLAKVIDPQRVDFEKEGLAFFGDVAYSSQHERQKLDLWYPKNIPGPLPAIVWIHGGGWSDENLTKLYRPEPELAAMAKKGFVCVSIEYRLCQHAPFPAQISDCKCAIRFLRAHAGQYHIDPNRIGVWGESAGGHLTSLLAAAGKVKEFEGDGGWEEFSSEVQAACPWYAPNDMVRSALERNGDLMDRLFGGPIERVKDLVWAASPMKYVGNALPPMLLMHGDVDRLVPTWQSVTFYEQLKAHGNDAELVVVPGQGHGFFDGEEYYEKIEEFFKERLRSPREQRG